MQTTFACDKAKAALGAGMADWMGTTPADILKRNATVVGHLVQKLALGPVSASVNVVPKPTRCNSCGRCDANGNLTLKCYHCNSASLTT